MHITTTATRLVGAAGVNITPNTTGLPGASQLEKLVGTLVVFGVIAGVAGVCLSAIMLAVGHHSSNPQIASRGKTGILAAAGCAILCGGATVLTNFFYNWGSVL
jgi:hypothetical protein